MIPFPTKKKNFFVWIMYTDQGPIAHEYKKKPSPKSSLVK